MDKIILKELKDQFLYYYDGIKAQKDIGESPIWYYEKTTHVLNLTMKLGLLKELCELLPDHVEWIVNDILENLISMKPDGWYLNRNIGIIADKIDQLSSNLSNVGK
jgi:hypothetical protein